MTTEFINRVENFSNALKNDEKRDIKINELKQEIESLKKKLKESEAKADRWIKMATILIEK